MGMGEWNCGTGLELSVEWGNGVVEWDWSWCGMGMEMCVRTSSLCIPFLETI